MRKLLSIIAIVLLYQSSWAQTTNKIKFKELPAFLIKNTNYKVVIQEKDWIATVKNNGQLCFFFQKQIEKVWFISQDYNTSELFGIDVLELPIEEASYNDINEGVNYKFDIVLERKGNTVWINDYTEFQLDSADR